jgi:hypothetical protein
VKPVIETLSFVLRTRLHHPVLRDRVLCCDHCSPQFPTWPCPTVDLIGAVMRGEA